MSTTANKVDLLKGEAWRVMDINGSYESNIGEYRKQWDEIFKPDIPNPYHKCSICEKEFDDSDIPYMSAIKCSNSQYQFRVICKACAYSVAETVIESDGSRISTSNKGIE